MTHLATIKQRYAGVVVPSDDVPSQLDDRELLARFVKQANLDLSWLISEVERLTSGIAQIEKYALSNLPETHVSSMRLVILNALHGVPR